MSREKTLRFRMGISNLFPEHAFYLLTLRFFDFTAQDTMSGLIFEGDTYSMPADQLPSRVLYHALKVFAWSESVPNIIEAITAQATSRIWLKHSLCTCAATVLLTTDITANELENTIISTFGSYYNILKA